MKKTKLDAMEAKKKRFEQLYNICSTQRVTLRLLAEVKKWLSITSTNTTAIMQLATLQTYLKITLWVQLPILKIVQTVSSEIQV